MTFYFPRSSDLVYCVYLLSTYGRTYLRLYVWVLHIVCFVRVTKVLFEPTPSFKMEKRDKRRTSLSPFRRRIYESVGCSTVRTDRGPVCPLVLGERLRLKTTSYKSPEFCRGCVDRLSWKTRRQSIDTACPYRRRKWIKSWVRIQDPHKLVFSEGEPHAPNPKVFYIVHGRESWGSSVSIPF